MKDNGGPAFATSSTKAWDKNSHEYEDSEGQEGMSLRDWFAGMALTGLCMAHDKDAGLNRREFLEAYPEASYALADAMIAEREKV